MRSINKKEKHMHSHGEPDFSILSAKKGIRAVKWSFIGMMITFTIQALIVFFTGSVALLADTVHNFGDAATAIPLGAAYIIGLKKPGGRFTYGYGRFEDIAGIIIVLIIFFSAVVAGYESVDRFVHPQNLRNVWAVIAAAVIGFAGNETVAVFRIKTGKEIGSAALVADGYHARIDGFASLSVLFGAVGVLMGFPLADPIIGLLITFAILKIAWDSIKTVFLRLLDGVDTAVLDEIDQTLAHVEGICRVTDVKARWIGHGLYAEAGISVDPGLPFKKAYEIAENAEHELMHHITNISNAVIRIEPEG